MNDAVISVVSTGRRMQSSDRFMAQDPAGAPAARGVTLGAVGEAELAVGDDGLAALKAAFEDGFVLLHARHLDRLHGSDAVLDHEDE